MILKIIDDECLKCKFVPKDEDIKKYHEFGKKLSELYILSKLN